MTNTFRMLMLTGALAGAFAVSTLQVVKRSLKAQKRSRHFS